MPIKMVLPKSGVEIAFVQIEQRKPKKCIYMRAIHCVILCHVPPSEPVPEPAPGSGGHGLAVTKLPGPAQVQGWVGTVQLCTWAVPERRPWPAGPDPLHQWHGSGVFREPLHLDGQHVLLRHRPVSGHGHLLGHQRGGGPWGLDWHVPHWWASSAHQGLFNITLSVEWLSRHGQHDALISVPNYCKNIIRG